MGTPEEDMVVIPEGGMEGILEEVMGDTQVVDMGAIQEEGMVDILGVAVVVMVEIAALVVAAETIMVGVAGAATILVRLWMLSLRTNKASS